MKGLFLCESLRCIILVFYCWSIANTCAQISAATEDTTPSTGGSFLCHVHDTRSGTRNSTCMADRGESCFTLLRRTIHNTFYVKRGCQATCTPDYRNRSIRQCCSTSLCNTHHLTPENFSAVTRPTRITDPAFITQTAAATVSEDSTPAPSHTIKPPQLFPEQGTPDPEQEDRIIYYTCNCNRCGSETECVGSTCVTSFRDPNDESSYEYFCSNSTCSLFNICCDNDHCNRIVERPTTPVTTVDTSTSPDIVTSGMMSSTTPTPLNATSEPTDLYFIIAIIISVVGGVVVVALIVVIMVMIIMKHRRRGQHNVLRQTPPPPTTNKYKPNSIPQLQTTPITLPQSTGLSSSLSLISIDSNYHSGKFSSHSTLSHSGKSSSNSTLSDSSKAADCPLKYLGTSV